MLPRPGSLADHVGKCKENCKEGCVKCCIQGQTDPLEIEYCRVASSDSKAQRDPNPNAGVVNCCLSTTACLLGLGAKVLESKVIPVPPHIAIPAQITANVLSNAAAGANLYRTTNKNIPSARNEDGEGVVKGRVFEEMSYAEKTHVPRTMKNVAIAGGGLAAFFFTGSWAAAAAVTGLTTCVSQTVETGINCDQERPYVTCVDGAGFFSCCACSRCCTGEEADTTTQKLMTDGNKPKRPGMSRGNSLADLI